MDVSACHVECCQRFFDMKSGVIQGFFFGLSDGKAAIYERDNLFNGCFWFP